jgi:hypothetical protein
MRLPPEFPITKPPWIHKPSTRAGHATARTTRRRNRLVLEPLDPVVTAALTGQSITGGNADGGKGAAWIARTHAAPDVGTFEPNLLNVPLAVPAGRQRSHDPLLIPLLTVDRTQCGASRRSR